MPVAVVTDSSAHLPSAFVDRYPVTVVPLRVSVDGADATHLPVADLVAALGRRAAVSTSRPTPGEFADRYRALLDDGADAVVSVHLSRALSGTWESARLAAEQVDPERVRIVDSRSIVMGVGFAAVAAVVAATAGAARDEVFAAAETAAARVRTLFSVDTLDYLRRGGRIGSATALLGTALAVKPLLRVVDGRVLPVEKVRTASRARARLVELAVADVGPGPVDVAVHHLGAVDRATEIAGTLRERLPGIGWCEVSEVGAALGAHTGPGVLGIVLLPGGVAGVTGNRTGTNLSP